MKTPANLQSWVFYLLALFFVLLSGCERNVVQSTSIIHGANLTDDEVSSLKSKKAFFGHQSVGDNIVQGIRDLMTEDPRLKLNLVNSSDPEQLAGPAFVECHIGHNGKPESKTEAFAAILKQGMGKQGGIVMHKYCFVDFDSSTDVQRLFENYRDEINALKREYPLLRIVHITVPLTTVEPAPKAWVKTMLGRTTAREASAKRNEFNRLLKQSYASTDPIFDLAEVESTLPDGSRSYFMRGNEKIYTLAPKYTTDGGHLNDAGRCAAAERLLRILARL